MACRIIPAIMSGGAGTRLWPLSTEAHPKQFHALAGARSLFAETLLRFRSGADDVSFAPPLILCGNSHKNAVSAALAEAGVSASQLIIEPAPRNTAAVAATAALAAQQTDTDALVLLTPSDHLIADIAALHEAIARAAPFARDRIVTFGIRPTRPAVGYGYIKPGATLGNGVCVIESFEEKPDAAAAQAYVAGGQYLWNSGMFLFSPEVLLSEFAAHAEIRDRATEAWHAAERDGDAIRLGSVYAEAPELPLDKAVMERTPRAAVVPCDIGWADIGSWAEVWRLAPRGASGFALLGSAASADISKMLASGVRAVAIDGDDLVVVAAPNGLLILPRERAEDANALRDVASKL
jgi:mannose-1-phosphate guanylyltransferase/mannose-6-phosphate isomerase